MSFKVSKENAPKDGSVFLADFGYGTVAAAWSKAENQWVTALFQLGLYQGGFNDAYFETEYFNEDELKGWMPMPEIPHAV